MDALDASDLNETQATQRMDELLNYNPNLTVENNDHSSVLKSQAVQSNEVSSESIPSSRTNNSAPHYHLHGLASTQSQPNNQTEEEFDGGSQKENIGAVKISKEPAKTNRSPTSRSHSPHVPSSRNVPSKGKNAAQTTAVNVKGTNKKSTITAVAFDTTSNPDQRNPIAGKSSTRQKSYKSSTKPPPSRYKAPPRPISPASSIDSFARDPDENIEEAFVARNEQFEIPLSELGRATPPKEMPPTYYSSEEDSQSLPKVLVPDSQEEDFPEVANLSQQFNASTQIDGEAEQMSVDEPPSAQPRDHGYEYESSASDSTSPYGSYPKDGEDAIVPAVGESTQPSTQPDDIPDTEPPFNTAASLWSNILSSRPMTSTSVPQSNPRSLLSMVRPDIQHRYKNYAQPNTTNSFSYQPQQRQPLPPSASGTGVEETQPSVITAPQNLHPAPAQQSTRANQMLAPSVPPAGRRTVKERLPSTSYPQDPMDVVPDSEPPLDDDERPPVQESRGSTSKRNTTTPATKGKGRKNMSNADEDVEMTGPNKVPATIDEENEDNEDDTPLAAAPHRVQRGRPPIDKGKRKAVDEVPAPAGKSTTAKAAAATKDNKTSNDQKKRKLNRSWETGIVPSSIPEENIAVTQRVTRATNNLVKQENKTTATRKKPTSRQTTRSTSSKPKSQTKRARAAESDEEMISQDDDEYDDDEATDDAEDAGRGKRSAALKRPPSRGKQSEPLKRVKGEDRPVARQVSRTLRSVNSSVAPDPAPTRVFALWNSDGHYYSGTIHFKDAKQNNLNDERYVVHFDDSMTETVSVDDMRRGELLVGDNVLFGKRSRPVKVVAVDNVAGGSVVVDCKGDNKIPLKDIRISHKDIVSSWSDRVLAPNSIIPTLKTPPATLNYSPSKSSLRGGGNTQVGILSGTGLISTVRVSGAEWSEEKFRLASLASQIGVRTFTEFSKVITIQGRFSADRNRYTLMQDDIVWAGEDINRLFLIADECNLKPKFLLALALGIPCLSSSWLYDSVNKDEEMKWTEYLLPAGWSESLNGHPSQHINFSWGGNVSELHQIKSNPFPAKLFTGKHFLCVGEGMVDDGNKIIDQKTIPQVVLAMGAKIVECVKNPTYASHDFARYDYILIRDQSLFFHEGMATTIVDWAWVKESLISSRLAPLPNLELEQSQEA